MKNVVIVIFAVILCLCSCNKSLITPNDFYVTIDKSTKFKAGEPVKFKLNGESDYYMFFSGEMGHEYRYKDRTLIDLSLVKSAELYLETWPDYTTADRPCPITFYISKTFEGLAASEDIDANRAIMKAEVESGMKNWEQLDWTVGPLDKKTVTVHDISAYLDHFCFAIHYYCPYKHPTQNKTWGQCSFNMSGDLKMVIDGLPNREFTFGDMDRSFVFMAEDDEGYPYEWVWKNYYYMYDYYYQSYQTPERVEVRTHVPSEGLSDDDKKKLSHKNVGGLAFGWNQGDIRFVGAGPNENNFDVDTWIVYSPIKLNSIDRDTGEVVKNMENDLSEYSYTYTEPGTYTATFHGFNVTSGQRYDKIVEIPVTITD